MDLKFGRVHDLGDVVSFISLWRADISSGDLD
jgi:hypothetical protein